MARRPPEPADFAAPQQALQEALARARRHAKRSLAEALEAARALVDAAALVTSAAPADAHPIFARADRWIRQWSRSLAADGELSDELGAALAETLQAEIARWEQRARSDEDARAVLRAFLGLRELLWELGLRPAAAGNGRGPEADTSARDAKPNEPKASEDRTGRRRVERVPVQGG